MRTAPLIGCVLAGSAALAVLAACSGNNGTTGQAFPQAAGRSARTTSIARRAALITPNVLPPSMQARVNIAPIPTAFGAVGGCPKQQVVFPPQVEFVSDFNNNAIYELDTTGVLCATLNGFSGPEGLSDSEHTDRKRGHLYVANTGASNVLEINETTGAVINTYADPNEYPVDVCVDPKGNLAVMNLETTAGAAGNIALYKANAFGGPTGSASAPTYTSPRFCAFIHSGKALVFDDADIFNTGAVNAAEVDPGNYAGAKNVIPLPLPNAIQFPGQVAIDDPDDDYDQNNTTIVDQSSAPPAIYTYLFDINAKTLTLKATTPLASSKDPVGFAFIEFSKRLLTADAGLDSAQAYFYPVGGNTFNNIALPANGLPIGVASDPTEQY
jgi:hypothetical protein